MLRGPASAVPITLVCISGCDCDCAITFGAFAVACASWVFTFSVFDNILWAIALVGVSLCVGVPCVLS